MFKQLAQQLDIPSIEKEILKFWDEQGIFQKSIWSRDANKPFVFYEGPPTANGRPGIHHVIARTLKDLACRLRTMQGYRVERKAGWDTHGLPVEIEVEKQLGFNRKEQIIEYGVDKFNALCRENVWKYKALWDDLTRRMGYWVDLEHPYITYENSYIESVWWIIKEFWQRDLMYLGHKIVPYCPRCETALSSHEVSLGYDEVDDPSVFVKMKLKNSADTFFLVWTTTPWTLISNVALALHPHVEYVKVEHNGQRVILAEARLSVLKGEYTILEKHRGKDLLNLDYEPLFHFCNVDARTGKPMGRAHFTVAGDFVTTEDGTGIVHMAPAFGEDDYQAGRKYDLPVLQPVDKSGKFTAEVTPWAGQFVKDADRDIIGHLKKNGQLYRSEKYRHSYPHCWRCDSPLLYYAKRSWYIRTEQNKDRLLKANSQITWYPKEIGEGRFGAWLENNVDWALSRDRFWGTPLPIWMCEGCDVQECIGSGEELRLRSGKTLDDFHKPFIDEVTWKCAKCDGTMRRTPEVIDVWFDSGAMPFAQWHYPFENKEIFERNFPSDFISEAVDQTRGWFYSLLAIAALLKDQTCYKSCLVCEMVLDKEGQKMSKSRGNAVDPFGLIDKYGADPMRWYLLTVSSPWLTTRFDEEGILECVRKFFGTLLNTYSFFAMYANIDWFTYPEKPSDVHSRPEIDRWIVSELNALVERVEDWMNRYEVTRAARTISDFVIDDVSNWYVRRNRRRFWKSEMGADKQAAYETLCEVLVTVAKLIAPMTPFVAEEIYRNLTAGRDGASESVHLESYPSTAEARYQFREAELETQMRAVLDIVAAGRTARNEKNLRVRQPLKRIIVVAPDRDQRRAIERGAALIRDELNLKAVEFVEQLDQLTIKRAEPVFKALGPKFGKHANAVAEAIRRLSSAEVAKLEEGQTLSIEVAGEPVMLSRDEIRVQAENAPGLAVSANGAFTIALDTQLDAELVAEGIAREFVNRVQNMRKDAGFEVLDRIRIFYESSDTLDVAVQKMSSYVRTETLAEELARNSAKGELVQDWEINGEKASIGIERIAAPQRK
jgi:isoleucyl-tRNA synthetase